MRGVVEFFVGVALVLLSASCAFVPPLSDATNNFPFTSSIPIHDIVQRVKCDLSDALYAKIYRDDRKGEFKWMRSWTAKSDLTMGINESGGISPSFGLVQPLKNAFFLGAGPNSINTTTGAVTNVVSATSQNFTMGIGGSFNAQVLRTENLSFTVSLLELKRWKETPIIDGNICTPTAPFDLQAGLDLKSWLDEALRPVQMSDLASGIHPDPGSAKAPAAPAAAGGGRASVAAQLPLLTRDLPPRQKARYDLSLTLALNQLGIQYAMPPKPEDNDNCVTEPTSHAVFIPPRPPSASPPPTNLRTQAVTAAQASFGYQQQASVTDALSPAIRDDIGKAALLARAQSLRVEEVSQSARRFLNESCIKLNGTDDPGLCQYDDTAVTVAQLSPKFCDRKEYGKFFTELNKYLHFAELNSNAAQQNAALTQKLLTPDPPIESIAQSISFVVTLSASASPNWSLLYLRGPSNSGPLASVSGIRTHTLNIALGPPTGPGVQEVARVLNNQSFQQAIQSLRQ
jgi:hypothetical protein